MVRELVSKLRDEGGTVIYSTHHLAEAQMVCDRIIIMHNGQIRSDGTPSELMHETGTDSLENAYVSLTSDIARAVIKEESETRISKMWRSLLTPSSKNKEVGEDE
jgi:ABC-type multidrug transport system ATPase subunit